MRHLIAVLTPLAACATAALAFADALPPDSCPQGYQAGESCAGVTLDGPAGPDGTGPACAVCTTESYCHHPCIDGGPIVSNLICEVPDGGDCQAGTSSGGGTGSGSGGASSSGGASATGSGTAGGGSTTAGSGGSGGGCGQSGTLFGPWLIALAVPFLLWRRRRTA
ncbi:MAG TPA: hypothetical protein VMB50_10795 [Myxococcales bacterium]|nr:hypothetical protein [Myxococcales bacterium]